MAAFFRPACLIVSLIGTVCLNHSCRRLTIDVNNLPCKDGQCLSGYTCNLTTNICEILSSDSGCVLGRLKSCQTCDDNCAQKVANATAVCQALNNGTSFVCGYVGTCNPGFIDGNSDSSDGCETACSGTNVEICDGIDNDCNGLIDTFDPALDTPEEVNADCESRICSNCHVSMWRCNNGCALWACEPGWVNSTATLTDGCEYPCQATVSPVEICDGNDNDCNGLTDTADPALDTPEKVNLYCGATFCDDCAVTAWKCDSSACQISTCAAGHSDANDQRFDGCEQFCTPESDAEFCLRVGKNCGSVSAQDNCGQMRTAACGNCTLPETCGDGGNLNVCGFWWDCGWTKRAQLDITTTQDLAAGYSIKLQLNHAELVSFDQSPASGDDVRVLWHDSTSWHEIDRVLDPESSWARADTTIWFKLQQSMDAGSTDLNYFVYFGNLDAGPPLSDEGQVFWFADFFNRPNYYLVGNNWVELENSENRVGIANASLFFTDMSNEDNIPAVTRTFNAPITSGGFIWRFVPHWEKSGTENTFRIHMLLGQISTMPQLNTSGFLTAGSGPSLLVSGRSNTSCTTDNLEGLYTESSLGTSCGRLTTNWLGRKQIEVKVKDLSMQTYDVSLDGTPLGVSLNFSDNTVTTLDSVRFFTWQVTSDNFANYRGFDYVIVRLYNDPEPLTIALAPEAFTCN